MTRESRALWNILYGKHDFMRNIEKYHDVADIFYSCNGPVRF